MKRHECIGKALSTITGDGAKIDFASRVAHGVADLASRAMAGEDVLAEAKAIRKEIEAQLSYAERRALAVQLLAVADTTITAALGCPSAR